MAISDNGDTKTYLNSVGQAQEALGVTVVDSPMYVNASGTPKEAIGVVIMGGEAGGGGIIPRGMLGSADDLPTEDNTTGDSYVIDGALWVWNGEEWTGPISIVGPECSWYAR